MVVKAEKMEFPDFGSEIKIIKTDNSMGIHIFKLVAAKIDELHFLDDDLTMFIQLWHELK